LTPGFLVHCYIVEALKLYFNCDDARATELATGLTVLAFADQKTGAKDGSVLPEYALRRSTNDPAIVDRLVPMCWALTSAALVSCPLRVRLRDLLVDPLTLCDVPRRVITSAPFSKAALKTVFNSGSFNNLSAMLNLSSICHSAPGKGVGKFRSFIT
jgi:hypothetical protein